VLRKIRVHRDVGKLPAVDLLAVPAQQLAIRQASCEQFLVASDIEYPSGSHHRNGVGERERAPPVRDQDRGPIRGQSMQGAVDGSFGGRVDRAGGVVENQHPGIGDHGAGQGQSLTLTA